MALYRGKNAKRGAGSGKVLSFLFSSQCIASAAFIFVYIIFIHLALLYTEELKHHKGFRSSLEEISYVNSDFSDFSASEKQAMRIQQMQVKSEELKAAFGNLQGLHRKVKITLPSWAQALRNSFEGSSESQIQQAEGELLREIGALDLALAAVDVAENSRDRDGVENTEGQVMDLGGRTGNLEESENASDMLGQESGLEDLRAEDIVNVGQVVNDLLALQQGHAQAVTSEAEGKQERPFVEPLPEDTMEGILEETTLFVEERERSLARLTSFEPIDEDPPDLELSSQAEDPDEQSGAAEDGSGAAEDSSTEPPVDAFLGEAHQNHNRHLLGFSLNDAPLSSNPPCSQDMSALDPFGFMQASIQRAFDTGTGLVPGPATTFECEMTPDGQGQRCVDRDIVVYTEEEERELTSGHPDEIDFSWEEHTV